jgi:hypothetical protein
MPAQLDLHQGTDAPEVDVQQARNERLRALGYRFPTGRPVDWEPIRGRSAFTAFLYRLLSRFSRR